MQAVNRFKSLCQSYQQKQITAYFNGHSQNVQNCHARKFYFLWTYSLSQKTLVFHIPGITKSYKSSTLLSHPQGVWHSWCLHLRKAWERNEGNLKSILSREKWKVNYFFLSQKRSASQLGTWQALYFPQIWISRYSFSPSKKLKLLTKLQIISIKWHLWSPKFA